MGCNESNPEKQRRIEEQGSQCAGRKTRAEEAQDHHRGPKSHGGCGKAAVGGGQIGEEIAATDWQVGAVARKTRRGAAWIEDPNVRGVSSQGEG